MQLSKGGLETVYEGMILDSERLETILQSFVRIYCILNASQSSFKIRFFTSSSRLSQEVSLVTALF